MCVCSNVQQKEQALSRKLNVLSRSLNVLSSPALTTVAAKITGLLLLSRISGCQWAGRETGLTHGLIRDYLFLDYALMFHDIPCSIKHSFTQIEKYTQFSKV